MKQFFTILIIGFFMTGCGMLQVKNPVCETAPECSLICQHIPYPEETDLLLKIVNNNLLLQGVYTAEDAAAFLDRIEILVQGIATYADLVIAIDKELSLLPAIVKTNIIVLSDAVFDFCYTLPICEFDRNLMLKGVENQRRVLLMH